MGTNNNNGFTPTQKKMLEILSDGLPHTREELHACCGPSSRETIRVHLSAIRKKLRYYGQDVICVSHHRTLKYQQVRLLAGGNE